MTKEIWKGITILVADNGAYVTDGDVYTDRVYLGKNADESKWRDASAEEKAEHDRQQDEPKISTDEALTRYTNEITGASDSTLQEATETLIKQRRNEQ